MSDLVDIDVLRRLVSYNPETGVLTWRERPREFFKSDRDWIAWNGRNREKIAGTPHSAGYVGIRIFGKSYLSHRVCYAIYYGFWPKDQIDHINGNRSDNRIQNLRNVTSAENHKNARLRSDNSTGVTGVRFSKRDNKWQARIKTDGREKHLGYFADINDAIAVRKAAEREYGFHQNHGRQEMLR